MKKTLITALIIVFTVLLITICSADIETVYVNGEENPILSPGEPINFSWNPNCSNSPFLKVWIEGTKSHIYHSSHPISPLLKEDGFNSSGNYTVEVHCSKCSGDNCGNKTHTGNFIIEESEPEYPEPEPYTGPVFVTHIVTLHVTSQ